MLGLTAGFNDLSGPIHPAPTPLMITTGPPGRRMLITLILEVMVNA